jgi:hypothetical protein
VPSHHLDAVADVLGLEIERPPPGSIKVGVDVREDLAAIHAALDRIERLLEVDAQPPPEPGEPRE